MWKLVNFVMEIIRLVFVLLPMVKKLIMSTIKTKIIKGNIHLTTIHTKETTKDFNPQDSTINTINIKVLIKAQILKSKVNNLKVGAQNWKTLLHNSCKHPWLTKGAMKRP